MITVIIPTYKRPHLLKRAIESVLKQTHQQFKIAVYDNASGDETFEVVNECIAKDKRVEYFCHKENIGMMANYKFAFNNVDAPFFLFLSDDDLLFPGFLEKSIEIFERQADIAFVAGSALIMTEGGRVVRVPLSLWPKEGFFSSKDGVLEMVGKYPIPSCVLFRREMVEKIEIDGENPLLWDCDFLLHVGIRFPFYIFKEPSGIFLQHPNSYSSFQNINHWVKGTERIISRLKKCEMANDIEMEKIESLMMSDLKISVFNYIRHCFGQEKYEELRDAAALYRSRFGSQSKIQILILATKICKNIWIARWFIKLLKFVKKSLKKEGSLQNDYGSYSKWLKGQNL